MSARARQLGAEKIVAVATSALREAGNGAAFCALCEDSLGVQVELLSGETEARLAYLGARSSIGSSAGRVLVVDVGGGSVELAVGDGATCDVVQSLPLGFLRLAQTFPLSEVGGAERLTRYVQLECEKARWQIGRFDTLLLSGGTARALGKLIGGGVASANTGRVLKLCHRVGAASPADLVEMGVDVARSVSLATGAAVVAGILAGFQQREVHVSPRGLREGVLLRELERRERTQAA
jgi:exopolyphosphatase/guanosine-5'-triphosphate,3'-diphosphate pyrophosphatase